MMLAEIELDALILILHQWHIHQHPLQEGKEEIDWKTRSSSTTFVPILAPPINYNLELFEALEVECRLRFVQACILSTKCHTFMWTHPWTTTCKAWPRGHFWAILSLFWKVRYFVGTLIPVLKETSSFSLEALLIFLFSLQIRLFWSCIIYTLVENPISVENGPFFTDFMWVKILIPLCGGLLFEVEKVSDLRYHHWVLCSVGYCHLQLFAGLLVQLLRLN